MMSSRKVVWLCVAAAVLLVGGWCVWYKVSSSEGGSAEVPPPVSVASASGTPRSAPKVTPVPAPVPQKPAVEDIFPLSPDLEPRGKPPPMPEGPRAPVVFLAPLYSLDDRPSSASDQIDYLLRCGLRAAPKDRLTLNLVPYDYMNEPYLREDGSGSVKNHKPEEYLRDASLLDADMLIYGRAGETGDNLSVQLAFFDLRTSKSSTWSSSVKSAEFPELIKGAARACAKACGLTDAQIDESGFDKNVPNAATWVFWKKPGDPTSEEFRAAINADPECIALREAAIWAGLDDYLAFANSALKRWPDDIRLLCAKAAALRSHERAYVAYLMMSELARRYPDHLKILHDLPRYCKSTFSWNQYQATVPPQAYFVSVETLASLAKRFPKNWYVRWDYGFIADNLSYFARGAETADKVSAECWQIKMRYSGIGLEELQTAANLRPDCPSLLRALLQLQFSSEDYNIDKQRTILEQIHKIDPSNVEAEMIVAFSHSVGWTSDRLYLPIVQEAAKRHAGDGRAMRRIARSLVEDIRRSVSFRVGTWEGLLGPNPESDLFIQCAEAAIKSGYNPGDVVEHRLYDAYLLRGETAKGNEIVESGRYWFLPYDVARRALEEKKDYEKALKMARLALKAAVDPKDRESVRYIIVKSLWKLKRYDESLEQAGEGFAELPNRATFHYLFAVVALEKGDRLEEALTHAQMAADMDPANAGIKDTVEKLKAKLGKQ
jgi:tetratricopeptide (TPR) repeat protein